MDLLKLIGVVFVIVGFILKWDTIATVVAAGIITGLVAVMSGTMQFIDIFGTLGSAYVTNRTATLFALTVGVIGISERYGLRDKAVDFIRKFSKLTTGGVLSIYLVIRTLSAAFSLRLGGHVQFIRPIVLPMAQGAAVVKFGEIDEKSEDEIKGASAAADNYGNFFAQNCFMGASGTLLIASTLSSQGYPEVDALKVAMASWPVAILIIVVGILSNFLLVDRKLVSKFAKKASTQA